MNDHARLRSAAPRESRRARRPSQPDLGRTASDPQRAVGNRALASAMRLAPVRLPSLAGTPRAAWMLMRMPYDSLQAGRYYRVKRVKEVLYLKQRHRQDGCRFTQHEDDLLASSVGIPSFDDVEREATAAEITAVRAKRLLAAHAETLERVDRINRQLRLNSARIRSGQLGAEQSRELRDANLLLSQQMSRLLEPVIADLFRTATDYAGLRVLMGRFLRGQLPGTPWASGRLMPESSAIAGHLQAMTELGFITYESQPSGQSHELSDVPGVHEHQNAYLELSGPPELMAALQERIAQANSTLARQIIVVKPGQEDLVALRTLVDRREGVHEVHPQRMRVTNNNRYQRQLHATNPALREAMEGHVTLVLVSSTHRDVDATVLFDDLLEMMPGAVASAEHEALAANELTPEEANVGHIAELK
ncbi:MAG: hypothetical protein WB698_13035 [Solirubrobacteraceae bacterium]